jgi:transporter family-2 protein
MNQFLILFCIFLVGGFIAMQGAVNSALGKHLGDPIHAALVSFGTGFIALLIISLVFSGGFPSVEKLSSIKPINLIGGILGVAYITSMVIFVPKIGIANALVASLCGQVILSLVLDHFGLLGLNIKSIDFPKILGALFIVAGLLLTNYKQIGKLIAS